MYGIHWCTYKLYISYWYICFLLPIDGIHWYIFSITYRWLSLVYKYIYYIFYYVPIDGIRCTLWCLTEAAHSNLSGSKMK